jgi:dipeptidase D
MSNSMELKPAAVFHYFSEICAVPRPSKKEQRMIAYLKAFGEKHQLETKVDEAGNVIIRKPATPGYEDRQTVVLQSHMDMVCEKNSGVEHNFDTDPIQTYIDGEWLRAKGTTLGADNGIGVATELAVLAADDIEHGPIECLFTVDEETGLTGAFALKRGFMTGDILLNLDSEDEGEMFIGCAGGCRTTATFRYKWVPAPLHDFYFKIGVKNLTGGHSGDDINKNRANANKLLSRFIYEQYNEYMLGEFNLYEFQGGNLHNAIPREAHAYCSVPMADKEKIRIAFNLFASEVEEEFSVTEKGMELYLESAEPSELYKDDLHCIAYDDARRFISALQAVCNGVFAMSQDIEGLVETSSNLASIKMEKDFSITVTTSQRSSILSARMNVANAVRAAFELAGAEVEVGEGYPGWKPNPASAILKVAEQTYEELFGVAPKVKAIHAGLECGLFLEKYPHMDMISFGPTLRGVHSPDERMHIPSVEKFWNHLMLILKRIPAKK